MLADERRKNLRTSRNAGKPSTRKVEGSAERQPEHEALEASLKSVL